MKGKGANRTGLPADGLSAIYEASMIPHGCYGYVCILM